MNNKLSFYDDELIINIVENVFKSYEINDGFNVSLDLSNNIYNNSKCDGREDSNHYAMNSSLLGNILNEIKSGRNNFIIIGQLLLMDGEYLLMNGLIIRSIHTYTNVSHLEMGFGIK